MPRGTTPRNWRGARRSRAAHERCTSRPSRCTRTFERAFWCEDLGIYALALDGDKRRCRVVTSNAGQCLFSGHRRRPAHARRVAEVMACAGHVLRVGACARSGRRSALQPDVVSQRLGVAARHRAGRSRPGALRLEGRVVLALTRACSTPRVTSSCTACRSCSAASRAARRGADSLSDRLRAAGLGVGIGLPADPGAARDSTSMRPAPHRLSIPAPARIIEWLRLTGLSVGPARLDLLCERRGDDVGISVIGRKGDIAITTER